MPLARNRGRPLEPLKPSPRAALGTVRNRRNPGAACAGMTNTIGQPIEHRRSVWACSEPGLR